MHRKEIEHGEKEEKRIDETRIDMCQTKTVPPPVFKRRLEDDVIKNIKIPKVESSTFPSPSQCTKCDKKLKFINSYTCRCGNSYCNRHRFFDQHGCEFDFKTEAKTKLKESNPKIVAEKINRS